MSNKEILAKHGDRVSASIGGEVVPTSAAIVDGMFKGVNALKAAKSIELDRIIPDPDQPRKSFDKEELQNLSDSLRGRGLLQPIRVRWDSELKKWIVVAGERRYRAAILAGWKEIACVSVEKKMSKSEILTDQLIENCLREDLKDIERANAFKTLMEANDWSMRQLATELHMTHVTVSRALSLLNLPQEIQDQVESGEIAPSAAAQIATIPDKQAQKEVAKRVVKEKLTRDQVADVVKEKAGKQVERYEYKLDKVKVVVTGAKDEAAVKAALLKLARQIGKPVVEETPVEG